MNGGVLWGLAGLAIGFVFGYWLNDKLNGTKREEVIFEAASRKVEEANEKAETSYREEERKKARDIAKNYGYKTPEEALEEDEGPEDDDPVEEPCIITPDEFKGSYLHAECAGLTYYQQDDVLTDPDGEPIKDVTDTIGEDAEWVVANTDDDVVYVYNDEYEMKYEIKIDHYSSYFDEEES